MSESSGPEGTDVTNGTESARGSRIALVGGAGFIGSRLAPRLEEAGAEVRTIDLPGVEAGKREVAVGDVRDSDALQQVFADCDCIVNLAAEHRDDVEPLSLYWDVNVDGARNVCDAARAQGINRIVFTSTVAVYGFTDGRTVDENTPFAPFNEYGKTKAEAERIFVEWQAEAPDERSLVIVRPTVVFGEDNRGNVYNLLKQVWSGRFVMIGDGKNRKSMAYVENVAAFLAHSMSFGAGVHVYNYVDKPDFDMNTLVSRTRQTMGVEANTRIRVPYGVGKAIGKGLDGVARVLGRSFPISAIRIEKFCANTVFETGIAESGFVAPVPLEDGLDRTIRAEFLGRR